MLQIGIGIVDLSFCALAMYVLMPDEPHMGFVTLALIFSRTCLVCQPRPRASLSMPCSSLWQYDKEDLIAGLLLFRLLYYVIPFALSLVVLGVREIVLAVGNPPSSPRDENRA